MEWMVCHSGRKSVHKRLYYLQLTNFSTLTKKDSLILRSTVPIHVSGKQAVIEIESVIT